MANAGDNRLEIFNQIMIFLITLAMGTMTEILDSPVIRIYSAYAVIFLYMMTALVNWIVVVVRVVKDLCTKFKNRKR